MLPAVGIACAAIVVTPFNCNVELHVAAPLNVVTPVTWKSFDVVTVQQLMHMKYLPLGRYVKID